MPSAFVGTLVQVGTYHIIIKFYKGLKLFFVVVNMFYIIYVIDFNGTVYI